MPDYSANAEKQPVTVIVESELSTLSARIGNINVRLERVLFTLLGKGHLPVNALDGSTVSKDSPYSGFFPEIISRIDYMRGVVNQYETLVDIFTNEFPSEGR